MEMLQEMYRFIAFDEATGELLAHGKTAVSALDQADRHSPDAAIRVVSAGALGFTVWIARMRLTDACEALGVGVVG